MSLTIYSPRTLKGVSIEDEVKGGRMQSCPMQCNACLENMTPAVAGSVDELCDQNSQAGILVQYVCLSASGGRKNTVMMSLTLFVGRSARSLFQPLDSAVSLPWRCVYADHACGCFRSDGARLHQGKCVFSPRGDWVGRWAGCKGIPRLRHDKGTGRQARSPRAPGSRSV